MATPPWTAFDGAKLHSGAAKVLGVTVGGQAGTVAVTIENDGVILYDASRKRRIRAWALGSRRTVGLPAVFDAESQQYFLLIRAAEGSEDCSLVSFSDDSSVKLDEAPKLSVFSSALATFPATAAGSRGTGGSSSGGGVLVVLRKGGLRWLRPDGTDQCPCQNGSESARAVAAAAIHGGDGAAIVAVARAEQGKEGAAQSIDLYIAGAGQMQQLRHSASATLDASAGPVASVVPLDATSVAVLFADGSLRVFRNGGGARSASGAAALAQVSACQLGCFLAAAPASDPVQRPSKRKAADAGKALNGLVAGGASGLALCPCPGGYILVSGLSNSSNVSKALSVAEAVSHFAVVVDAIYGLVHAAGPVESAAEGRGSAPMVCSTVPGQSADEPLCLCAIGSTVRAFPLSLPPLLLANVSGRLSAATDRASLTRAVMTAAPASTGGELKLGVPIWVAADEAGAGGKEKGASAGVRRVDPSKLWDEGAMQAQQSAEVAAATAAMRRLRSRAGESSSAPAGAGGAGADEALRRCVQAAAWGELSALLDQGLLTSSAACPDLVPALIAAGERRLLRRFLASALDASADLPAALLAAVQLAADGSAEGSADGSAEDLTDLRQVSVGLLQDAERAAASRNPAGASAALPAARVAVAALERFSPSEAALLHAVVAARSSDEAAAAAVQGLPTDLAVAFLAFLEKWLRVYSDASVPAGSLPLLFPSLDKVVSWTGIVLDAFWSTLVFHASGKDAVRRLAGTVKAYVAVTSKLSFLEGCASDIIAKKPLPAPQGTVSAVYSVEFVDLP